jgi:hypothetical protein
MLFRNLRAKLEKLLSRVDGAQEFFTSLLNEMERNPSLDFRPQMTGQVSRLLARR